MTSNSKANKSSKHNVNNSLQKRKHFLSNKMTSNSKAKKTSILNINNSLRKRKNFCSKFLIVKQSLSKVRRKYKKWIQKIVICSKCVLNRKPKFLNKKRPSPIKLKKFKFLRLTCKILKLVVVKLKRNYRNKLTIKWQKSKDWRMNCFHRRNLVSNKRQK